MRLRPWQRKIVRGIYDTPSRTVIISFAKKNAKTTLSAALCLLHLAGPEARPNSQLYSDAQSREQAGVLFELAAKMVRMSPDLDALVTVRDSTKQLFCSEIGTLYIALSAEHSTAHGKSPIFVVHDELGQVRGPRSELYEALENAMGAHDNPLSIIISTQAPTDADLLSILIDDAAAGHDPRTKLFLWTSDPDADPFAIKTIRSANPAFGDFLNRDEVLSQAAQARRMPSKEASFRNYNLNQRVNVNDPFVSAAVWKANGAAPRPEDFAGGIVAAVDLSEIIDLTAVVWVGQGEDGAWSVGCRFFAPEDGLAERAKRDRVPYDLWARQGYLTLTPGPSIRYAYVAQALGELHDEHRIRLLVYDRWHMHQLKTEIEEAEIDLPESVMSEHGQGFRDMSPALTVTETELVANNVRHGNHPMLTWCAANAVVTKDPAGNRKLNKAKSRGRIDGMVALCMALNRAKETVPAAMAPSFAG